MKHLFVAATDVATGELTHAARLAQALIAAGDQVVFLLPRSLDGIVATLGAKRGWIDDALAFFDRAILAAVESERPDTVLLVDGTSVAQAMVMRGLAFGAWIEELRRRTRVVALDVWNLDEAGLVVDYGTDTFTLPDVLLSLPRIVPVPFARLETPGGYCALGGPSSLEARDRARSDLGLGEHDRLISFALAAWQLPASQLHPDRAALAARTLERVVAVLAALPATVHVVLVGPHAPAVFDALGPRVHRAGLVAPARYAELLAAADLMLGTNIAATSLISALARGLPALVAIAEGCLVCPLGMSRFLGPVLAGNAYADAIATSDLTGLGDAVEHLLFDEPAMAAARGRQADYAARVRALPTAVTVYSSAREACRR